jgi:hypothetical protein
MTGISLHVQWHLTSYASGTKVYVDYALSEHLVKASENPTVSFCLKQATK